MNKPRARIIRENTPSAGAPALPRAALVSILCAALAACSGSDPDAAAEDPGATATPATTEQAPAEAATGAEDTAALEGMDVDELRTAARAAYAENRLYAPAGDNAIEYFLALRGASPDDASASSALTDLLPMTVIAIEQSIIREDFEESRRLVALLERIDGTHPALDRLARSVETGETRVADRLVREQVSAEEQAARQQELARERAAEQERQQQEAARQLAERQAAEEAQAQLAAEQAEREAADRLAAEQRAAEQRAAEQRRAARPTAADLRALSMPAPDYPRDALRTGQSGEVEVEMTVGVDGSVTAVRVIRADPARVFDRAATSAVERWRFQPLAAPVTARRTITFNPEG